jgi:NTE family protein
MARETKPSALDLLKKYDKDAELLRSDESLERLANQAAREEAGTIGSVSPSAVSRLSATSQLTPEAKEFYLDFALTPGIGLCLSGSGYKAMLYHAGALLRLNDAGFLTRLDRLAGVSTSSITVALLGVKWTTLDFDTSGIARNFFDEVISPLRKLADQSIKFNPITIFLTSVSETIAGQLGRWVYGDATLQDLPDKPRIIVNATNIQTGALWRFSKPHMGDHRIGLVQHPEVKLADAVAASAMPSPYTMELNLSLDQVTAVEGADLRKNEFTRKVLLTDGGIFDSLALETVWNRYDTVLVSDAAGIVRPDSLAETNWLMRIPRVVEIMYGHTRVVYKRQIINSFTAGLRKGAYWGIQSNISDYGLADALECAEDRTAELATLSSSLTALDPSMQERLVNWGYASCDAAMRRFLDPSLSRPVQWPYPKTGV